MLTTKGSRKLVGFFFLTFFSMNSTYASMFGVNDFQERVQLRSNEICAYPETAIRVGTDYKNSIWKIKTKEDEEESRIVAKNKISIIKSSNQNAYVMLNHYFKDITVEVYSASNEKVGAIKISHPHYGSKNCLWLNEINPSIEDAINELNQNTKKEYIGPFQGQCKVGDQYTDYYPTGANAYQNDNGAWVITSCINK